MILRSVSDYCFYYQKSIWLQQEKHLIIIRKQKSIKKDYKKKHFVIMKKKTHFVIVKNNITDLSLSVTERGKNKIIFVVYMTFIS